MDMERLKEDLGHTWRRLAEGWRSVSDKAANALTYFSPSKPENGDVGLRWGLLAAELEDAGDRLKLSLEAAGLDRDEIDVRVSGRELVVTGTKKVESERREGALHISERAYGRFQRVIPLPDDVETDNVSATYKKGVLRLELPKRSTPQARRVSVQAG